MDCCCIWEDIQKKFERPPCQYPTNIDNEQISIKCQQTTKQQVCERLKQYHELSTILQSVLDITTTIVEIMEFVCIHQCKCQKAMDVIIYAFLHFDDFTDRPCGHSRKQIRKDEFQCDLRRDCNFTKQETKITYAITKFAFQAFYFKQVVTRYDDTFIDECVWLLAAKKTVKAYQKLDGVEPSNIATFSTNVHCAYKHYLERRRTKNDKLRAKYECSCNQNRSNKTNWSNTICDTGKQPCSSKKNAFEYTKKDCTCKCIEETTKDESDKDKDKDKDKSNNKNKSNKKDKSNDNDNDNDNGKGTDNSRDRNKSGNDNNNTPNKNDDTSTAATGPKSSSNVPKLSGNSKANANSATDDCMKLKTCEEQLQCVKDKLLNMEKERADWEAEKLRLKMEADKIKSDANAYYDLLKKLGPDFNTEQVKSMTKSAPRDEFSIFLKFFQNGKNCQIDMTGLDLSEDYIKQVKDLIITNDTTKDPVNFRCIRT